MKEKEALDVLLGSAGIAGVIGLVTGIARGVVQARHGSIGAWVRGITASLVVGVMTGWALHDTDMTPTLQAAIIAVCAYTADDVLLGLLVLGSLFSRDPAAFAGRVIDSVRGRPMNNGEDKPQ